MILLASRWPFTKDRVALALGQTLGGQVTIGNFKSEFAPVPGCTAENVVIRDGQADNRALAVAERLVVEASWPALLTGRRSIHRVRIDNLQVYGVPSINNKSGSEWANVTVGELIANAAVLNVPRRGRPDALRFTFPELKLRNIGRKNLVRYEIRLQNPEPPGVIAARGTFGPWRGELGNTPALGSFEVTSVRLDHYRGIAGTLSGAGQFSGNLAALDVRGTTDIPDFEVLSSHHSVPLHANFGAIVDALNGDTMLNTVRVRLLNSITTWHGTIAGSPKVVNLDVESESARTQDLMRLVVAATKPPVDGPIIFRAHVKLPPGKAPFLKKLTMESEFAIGRARFTQPATEANVSRLSARASGVKNKELGSAEAVDFDLRGKVNARNGVATFSELTFTVPGALAQLRGTFNLLNENVDLDGTLATSSKLSNDVGGIESVLLRPLNSLFKKHHEGAVIPIHLGGTYAQPSYGFSLTPEKTRAMR